MPIDVGEGVLGLFLDKEFDSTNLSVLYLSDFDPSGEDMPRDIKERLEKYGAGKFSLKELALTKEPVRDYRLPPNAS